MEYELHAVLHLDHGSSQVKREPVDLVMEDYDVSLCQRKTSDSVIIFAKKLSKIFVTHIFCITYVTASHHIQKLKSVFV